MIEYENLAKTNSQFIKSYKKHLDIFFDDGWYILGKHVNLFEQEYAKFIGTRFCISVASGLDAMIIAIEIQDFPKGSEIIVASNTYIATILAIIRSGHTPILVEPDLETYNINPLLIEKSITKKTKGIIVTHLYGRPCEMNAINKIINDYNLVLFEDCAQAHGADYMDKKVGSFGIGCHSFYPTKNLGALGDGGAITFDNEEIFEKIKAFRNYGSNVKYQNKYIGLNSRLDEIQALFLNIKLKSINKINDKKIELAKIYDRELSNQLIKPKFFKNEKHVFHIYNIRHKKRDVIKSELKKMEIITDIHYPIPPHSQEGYKANLKGDYPVSNEIHNTTLSLPISFSHSKKDILKVANCINRILNDI